MIAAMGAKTTLVAGLAGILVWSILVVAASRHIGSGDAGIGTMTRETPDSADPVVAPFQMTPEAGIPAAASAVTAAALAPVGAANAAPPSVRPVQPDVFAYPVTPQAGALERVEARPFQMAKDPAVTLLKTQAIARPMTIEAGLIAVGKATLQLEGLKPTARTRQCESSTGVPWPCGMVARTQQRLFFRNRTLDCALDSLSWQGVRVADCALSGKSVGEWLVENGWAEAAAGSPLVEKGRQAVAARLGLFGDDPR